MEEDFDKLHVSELAAAVDTPSQDKEVRSQKTVKLVHQLLSVQERRSIAYSRLKSGFEDYIVSRGELAYQQLLKEIIAEFNDCSKQVREIESQLKGPRYCRDDLARLLRSLQEQEKLKLELTVKIQLLKKDGLPSKRLVNHDKCTFFQPTGHECVNIQPITEALGTEEAEADAQHDAELKKATQSLQDVVVSINDYLDALRYEIPEPESP